MNKTKQKRVKPVKPCPDGKILNPKTGRYVSIRGSIGSELYEQQQDEKRDIECHRYRQGLPMYDYYVEGTRIQMTHDPSYENNYKYRYSDQFRVNLYSNTKQFNRPIHYEPRWSGPYPEDEGFYVKIPKLVKTQTIERVLNEYNLCVDTSIMTLDYITNNGTINGSHRGIAIYYVPVPIHFNLVEATKIQNVTNLNLNICNIINTYINNIIHVYCIKVLRQTAMVLYIKNDDNKYIIHRGKSGDVYDSIYIISTSIESLKDMITLEYHKFASDLEWNKPRTWGNSCVYPNAYDVYKHKHDTIPF